MYYKDQTEVINRIPTRRGSRYQEAEGVSSHDLLFIHNKLLRTYSKES